MALVDGLAKPDAPVGLHARLTASLQMTEYRFSGGTPPHQGSHGITLGGDGNMWVTLESSAEVARVTPGGTVSYFALPSQYADPEGIAAGSDGNLWITEPGTNSIAVVSTAGTVLHEYVAGNDTYGLPTRITAGPDGNLWFTYSQGTNYSTAFYSAAIGRITITGVVTAFPVQCCDVSPFDITAGPDGNLWFTEQLGNAVGKVTPSGSVTEYPLSGRGTLGAPQDITSGPGGKLWFSETNAAQVAAISTDGQTVDLHPLGAGEIAGGMLTDSNGTSVWFTDAANDNVGEIDSATGTVNEYGGASPNAGLYELAEGSGGSLWVTEDQLPGVATFQGTVTPTRTVVFVHGFNGVWQDFRPGGKSWQSLIQPLRAAGNEMQAFEYFQDRGDQSPGGGSCSTSAPTPDTYVTPLYVDPSNDYANNVCDSQSALAPNAAMLYDQLQGMSTPTTIIANSMGGAITRGYLRLTQTRPSDKSLGFVDSVVFVSGVQQGAAIARNGIALSLLPGGIGQGLTAAAQAKGINPSRPDLRDLSPQSSWFDTVNPGPLPYLHYYNFSVDIQIHSVIHFLWWTPTIFTNDAGDGVILPGTDDPQSRPWDGGSRFLPFQPGSGQHQYLLNYGLEADSLTGWFAAAAAVTALPASHFNIGDNIGTILTTGCSSGSPSVSISSEIVRIVGNPYNACGA
ncbi:MAG: virginiamycin B lyase family protein [Candidatus Dormibacteria bacterium]